MLEINWTFIIPIAINVGMLIYFLGGLNPRIDNFSHRIDKLERENEKLQESYSRGDDRVRDVMLSLARMEPQINDIRSRVDRRPECSVADCPFANNLFDHGAKTQNHTPKKSA